MSALSYFNSKLIAVVLLKPVYESNYLISNVIGL